VVTDHSALTKLKTMSNSNARLMRWVLKLQSYDFDVVHRPGREHVDADFFSRQGCPEETSRFVQEVRSEIGVDGECKVCDVCVGKDASADMGNGLHADGRAGRDETKTSVSPADALAYSSTNAVRLKKEQVLDSVIRQLRFSVLYL
jgi:hypothetical protein